MIASDEASPALGAQRYDACKIAKLGDQEYEKSFCFVVDVRKHLCAPLMWR